MGKAKEIEDLRELYNDTILILQAVITKVGTTTITNTDFNLLKMIPHARRQIELRKVYRGVEIGTKYTRNLDLVRNKDERKVADPPERLDSDSADDGGAGAQERPGDSSVDES